MPAIELLCRELGINPQNFSKEENLILEAELYARVCEEVTEIYRINNREYFRLLKINAEMENNMIELNFIRCLINDILKSEAYTVSGIAYYTQTPEDVIHDLLINSNASPIISIIRRLIELHRQIRPEVYQNIIKKISNEQAA